MNMKKILIPIAVLLLTIVSVYSLVDTNLQTIREYEQILEDARSYAAQGIVDDAVKYYEEALAYDMNIDVYIEYMQVYVDNGQEKKALGVAEAMVEDLDDSEQAYECLLDRYIALESYEDCFVLDDEVTERNLRSEGFAAKMAEIEYAYALDYQNYTEVKSFSSGYAAYKSDELYGAIDETGSGVLSRAYKDMGSFSYYTNENNAEDSGFVVPVCTQDGQWMYVSTTGNKKIEIDESLQFDYLGIYVDKGLTVASINGAYAYYDTNFEKKFGDYMYASTFNCGRAAVQVAENEWYIINENGERLNQTPYLDVELDGREIAFRNNRAFVLIDDNYYMIDVDCNIIGEQKFISAHPFLEVLNEEGTATDVLAAVCIGGKWGFIDVNGQIIIEPQYMDAHSFSNGFAAVSQNSEWGFINPNGELVIDYAFEDVKDFNSKGCVFISTSSRWSLIKLYRYNH